MHCIPASFKTYHVPHRDTLVILTKQSIVSDLLQGAVQVAARLEASAVGVDVHVAHRLLDADA